MGTPDQKNKPLRLKTGPIEKTIHTIRGQRVMLDSDLALLYGVETKVLVQAMKRNLDRFPEDFSFQLSEQEVNFLRSQFVTSKGRGGRRYPPYAFTEQGVAMLSSVLKGKKAVLVNIEIMRAFVRLREIVMSHQELWKKINLMERKYDQQFKEVFEAIRALMRPAPRKSRRIGFKTKKLAYFSVYR